MHEGWLESANLNGPKIRGNWDNDFSGSGDRNAFHAKVFMAAYHYYYKDIKGLRRPPENTFWATQLRIRCHNESDNSSNGYYQSWNRFWGLANPLHIYNQQKLSDRPDINTTNIYATTIHELAHASHWNMSSGGDYSNSDVIVAESWARGVQWELTRMVWSGYTIKHRRRKLMDAETEQVFYNYTGVVKDMIDSDSFISDFQNTFGDNVSGYTIREIEDALQGQRTWNGWRDNTKNRYNNATENNLDALFSAWN